MNEINFLPQSYRNRLRTRQRRVRETTVVLLLAGAMGVFWVYGLTSRMSLRQDALQAENRLANALSTEQQIAELNQLKSQLSEQRRVQRSVRVPVRHHEVVHMLGSLMPESTALMGLTLKNQRPKPEPWRDPSLSKFEPEIEVEPELDTKPVKAEPDFIAVEFEALAPDDLTVAALIASLSEHPLFSRVKLHSSRFVDTRGVAARQFRVTAEVDLTRDFRWADAATKTSVSTPDALAEVSP